MVDNLTNFDDTRDVSDAAIALVLKETGRDKWKPASVRRDASQGFYDEQSTIIAARLIQQHRPDLLVDPVDALIEREMNRDHIMGMGVRDFAKRIYQMGIEAGKKS